MRFLVGAVGCAFGLVASAINAPRTWTEPITGMTFVEVPAGEFVMGSPVDEPGREAQERQHRVVISRPFWLGAYEVTQAEWRAVTHTRPSHFGSGDRRRPVEQVNWYEVQEFLAELSKRSPGSRFRLPTEAEWEYACRAGTTTPYAFGSALTPEMAAIASSPSQPIADRGGTHPVGSFRPNPWGLFDMHGNVWEWTDDDHCPYPAGPETDPHPGCGDSLKVIRGGSWYFAADSARCALRYTHRPRDRGFSLGFRVVRERQ